MFIDESVVNMGLSVHNKTISSFVFMFVSVHDKIITKCMFIEGMMMIYRCFPKLSLVKMTELMSKDRTVPEGITSSLLSTASYSISSINYVLVL